MDKAMEERIAFSDRYHEACKAAGRDGYRITEMARLFNAHYQGEPVTVHAVRKWIFGEAIPTQDKLQVLAMLLGVDAGWLRFGIDSTEEAKNASGLDPRDARLLSDLHSLNEQAQEIAYDFVRMLARQRKKAE